MTTGDPINAKPARTRIAALDYGMARIGVALSDETKTIAAPLKTLTTEKQLERTATKLVNELNLHQKDNRYTLEEIIIGLPLMLSGKSGLLADEVKTFVELLRKKIDIPVTTWDERLTTVQAERAMRESTMTRKQRSKLVDTVSAVILLQSYLDFKKIQTLRNE